MLYINVYRIIYNGSDHDDDGDDDKASIIIGMK